MTMTGSSNSSAGGDGTEGRTAGSTSRANARRTTAASVVVDDGMEGSSERSNGRASLLHTVPRTVPPSPGSWGHETPPSGPPSGDGSASAVRIASSSPSSPYPAHARLPVLACLRRNSALALPLTSSPTSAPLPFVLAWGLPATRPPLPCAACLPCAPDAPAPRPSPELQRRSLGTASGDSTSSCSAPTPGALNSAGVSGACHLLSWLMGSAEPPRELTPGVLLSHSCTLRTPGP